MTNTYSILGSARSGLAVAKLLRSEGAEVFVSDSRPLAEATDAIEQLEAMGVPYEFGGHTPRVLDASTIVLSPGVPDTIPIVRKAIAKGIQIVSEIEIASMRCRAPIVAITGTNGKTTTTELAGHIFRAAGRKTFVAGNVGFAFSEIAVEADEESVVVLEVSSFQLEHIVSFRPRVAVVTNVTPDHLDRYTDFAHYFAAKRRIAENQKLEDALILGIDSEPIRTASFRGRAKRLEFTRDAIVTAGAFVHGGDVIVRRSDGADAEKLIAAEEIGIRGPHNLYNAMAASLAALFLGVDLATVAQALREFKGVPHRLEAVGEIDGVRYVNDSKATNVDSVRYALLSFDEPIVLIAGGTSKKAAYDALFELVGERVKAIVLVGDAAEEMETALAPHARIVRAGHNMKDAVEAARAIAQSGDVVLLSPACASFDMFKNFEHRGDVFRALVQSMTTQSGVSTSSKLPA